MRGSNRISPATRQRVKQTARKLGYSPDPALSALSAYRTSLAMPAYSGNLAIISTYLTFGEWIKYEWAQELYQGIQEVSERLGYKTEYFHSEPSEMAHRQLGKVLEARGTQGLIILPDILHGHPDNPCWGSFAAVHVFGNPFLHNSHSIASNHYAEMRLVMEQLRERGYRRPGLFFIEQVSETSDRDWLAAFLAHRQMFPEWSSSHLRVVRGGTSEFSARNFQTWIRRTMPDVLINGGGLETIEWMRGMGLRVPEEIGYCSLDCMGQGPEVSGIRQSVYDIGGAAVSQLVSLLHRQNPPSVEIPSSILIHGQWIEGKTLRPVVKT